MLFATVIKSQFVSPSSTWRDKANNDAFAHRLAKNSHYVESSKPTTPLRILIVDGDESSLSVLSQGLVLANDSYRVGSSSSAEEALKTIEHSTVDVLITNLRLPTMNGLELMQLATKVSPKTRSILMTTHGNSVVFDNADKCGFVACIQKPFSIDALVNYIDSPSAPTTTVHADLHGINILDILETYSVRNANMTLDVTSGNISGLLIISNGKIIHAEFDFQHGPEALVAMTYSKNVTIKSSSSHIHTSLQRTSKQLMSVGKDELQAARSAISPIELLKIFRASSVLRQPDALKSEENTNTSETTPKHEFSEILRTNTKTKNNQLDDKESTSKDFSTEDLVLQPEPTVAASNRNRVEDFSPRDLLLQPETQTVEHVRVTTPESDKKQALCELIAAGIDHFRAHRLDDARTCWQLALDMDQNCKQAKKNLKVLESLLKPKTC